MAGWREIIRDSKSTGMPRMAAQKRDAAPPVQLGKMRTAPELRVYLRERYGKEVSLRTLQDWRVRGDGPPFRRFGRTPIYEEYDTDAWVLRHLSRAHRSTSDERTQRDLVSTVV
jgi:hypothetical protein